jgi:RHS repeat-associated protein
MTARTLMPCLTSGATSYHYLHTDHLATPILATDKTGSPTWKGASEAFGATMPTIQVTEMNLRFPGQYWDQETQTHYNFNRDYLPGGGRYLQGDPLGLAGGVNVYDDSRADPLLKIDPLGLCPLVNAYWVTRPRPWQSSLDFTGVTEIHSPRVSDLLTIYMFEAKFVARTRVVAHVTCVRQCCDKEVRSLVTIDKPVSHDFTVPIGFNPISAWFGPKGMIAMMIAEALKSSGYLTYTAEVARAIKTINDVGPEGLCLGMDPQ